MDKTRDERVNFGTDQTKKPYCPPAKLTVLGAVESVVLSGSSTGKDGSGLPSTAAS
jgi:hypothetical protein